MWEGQFVPTPQAVLKLVLVKLAIKECIVVAVCSVVQWKLITSGLSFIHVSGQIGRLTNPVLDNRTANQQEDRTKRYESAWSQHRMTLHGGKWKQD